MKRISLLIALVMVLSLFSCSPTYVVKSKGVNVASGTVVPFARMANEAFAQEYIGADIIVNCEFLAPNDPSMKYSIKKVPKGHFAFVVLGEGQQATQNEVTGTMEGFTVFAPLSNSDFVFSLKKGDKIQLRGGTYVTKLKVGLIGGPKNSYVHFKATNIKKQ